MNGKKNEIDELFSTGLEKFELPSSEKDWELLSSKLRWTNFWKFNLTGFNFYYVLLFAGLVGLTVWLGITDMKQSKKIDLLQDSIQFYNDLNEETLQLPSADFPIDSSQVNQTRKEKPILNNEINETIKANNKIKEQSNNSPEVENKKSSKDTAKTNIQPPINIQDTTSKPKIKRVKKVMYVKPPAVITRDTIKLKKPIE